MARRPDFPVRPRAVGPKADEEHCGRGRDLFDHLVGSHLHRQRYREAKRLRGLEIDEILEFLGLLHRKIGRLFAPEDSVEIRSNLPNLRGNVEIVGDQAARAGATDAAPINGRNPISCCQFDFQLEIVIRKGVSVEDRAAVGAKLRQDRFDIRDVAYWTDFDPNTRLRARRLCGLVIEMGIRRRLWAKNVGDVLDAGRDLREQRQPFRSDRPFEIRKSGNVAAWMGRL